MKYETIKIVPQGEVEKMLADEVKKHATESMAAKHYGITQPELSRARRGLSFPPRRLLDVMGLEVRRVVMPKSKGE